jgi:hypothetical protein
VEAFVRRLVFLLFMTALVLASACDRTKGPILTLSWQAEATQPGPVTPADALHTTVRVTNHGSKDVSGVVLRFDQLTGGSLPYGVTIGTASNVASRFEGDVQVWDLGAVEAGQTVVFPLTLWFDSQSPTLEPRQMSLYMQAESPALEAGVVSNALDVEVDTRAAIGAP